MNKIPLFLKCDRLFLLPDVEDVIPVLAEETIPSIPEEQSQTLIIEGELGNLAHEVETIEILEVEEEEGSSLPGKDDNEGEDVDDKDQVDNAPGENVEQQVMIRDEEQPPIIFKQNVS